MPGIRPNQAQQLVCSCMPLHSCRAAEAKPDVQAHRLELSDEESDEDMDEDMDKDDDMEQDDTANDIASPAAEREDAKEVNTDFISDSLQIPLLSAEKSWLCDLCGVMLDSTATEGCAQHIMSFRKLSSVMYRNSRSGAVQLA